MFFTIQILEKALNASWLKNEVISNNIAHADTPGFKAKTVMFGQNLTDALKVLKANKNTAINSKHIMLSNEKLNPVIVNRANTKARVDGNNVDIDIEMAELAENQILYDAMTKQVVNRFQAYKTVISEGRR